MKFGLPGGFATGDEWLAYVRDAFDHLYAEGVDHPKMMSIGLHMRLMGRPGRAAALAHFLDHVARHDRVWVCRRDDIARHWMEHHPYRVAVRAAGRRGAGVPPAEAREDREAT